LDVEFTREFNALDAVNVIGVVKIKGHALPISSPVSRELPQTIRGIATPPWRAKAARRTTDRGSTGISSTVSAIPRAPALAALPRPRIQSL
jgi:hypothetical protein